MLFLILICLSLAHYAALRLCYLLGKRHGLEIGHTDLRTAVTGLEYAADVLDLARCKCLMSVIGVVNECAVCRARNRLRTLADILQP